ncbi:hypothetical protein GXW83_02315 [Streptacidiphilus sp. PB12-B1b]|nr:hypothetical protein GXW83_02315 [Streptacidiphilus sp. PB12-B1b]
MSHKAPLTNHHADGSLCPAEHRHTSSGKPLHPNCPGRAYTQAICSCGGWQMNDPGKGYVNETRKRHLASHPKDFKALRDLLRLDGS